MIGYVFDVFLIILFFSLFGFLHSYFASNLAKRIIVNRFGNVIAFYRFFYVFFSLILFYMVYIAVPHPNLIIYDLPYPYDFIILIPQFLSLAGILWTLKYFSLNEFLGINQVFRWFNKEYNVNELDERLTLHINGPYKFSRHPVYLFSILFLTFRSEMDLFYLVMLICIIAYFIIGSFYEEKKLVEKFAGEYVEYQKTVPRIFPIKFAFLNKTTILE